MVKNIKIYLIILVLIILLLIFLPNKEIKLPIENNSNLENTQMIFKTEETKELIESKTFIEGFVRPFGITIYENKLYISDFGGHNILIYDKNHNFIEKIEPGIEIFNSPHSIDFDSQSNWYVTDFLNKNVQKLSKDGEFLKIIIDDKYLQGPATSYFDNEEDLLVTDYSSNALIKFDKDGNFLGWIGAKNDGTFTNGWEKNDLEKRVVSTSPGGFDRLHMARVDSKGDIYVADTWNNRVQKFSKEGKLIGWIGAKNDGSLTNGWEKTDTAIASSQPGGLNTPVSIDITQNNELIVFEFNGNRIQKFSKDGEFIEILATGFNQGYDAKVYDNKLYVVDTGNKRIYIEEL